MQHILNLWDRLWAWLIADNGVRALVILVVITGWYAFLTWRMAKAIARQTRAMIQPVVQLSFHFEERNFYPVGYIEVKNVGTQPLLVLDVELSCNLNNMMYRKHLTESFELWDEHIVPPGDSLRPMFDFKRRFEGEKWQWDTDSLSYGLDVVAADLSKQVVLRYVSIPFLGVSYVHKGMPLSVRWRYFVKPFTRQYRRLLYRFKAPKARV
jgi:hypothetical protein